MEASMDMVTWPTAGAEWLTTSEDGMWVVLVVHDDVWDDMGKVSLDTGAVFLGDDVSSWKHGAEDRHFPGKKSHPPNYRSIQYRAVIKMGEDFAPLWNDVKEEYFRCTYADLTEDGKRLYDAIKAAYPKSTLSLLTWLMT